MQGLADGYFILPYTIADHLAPLLGSGPVGVDHPAFRHAEAAVRDRLARLLGVRGSRSVDWFHRELGRIMWDYCGMSRSRVGLEKAISEIAALRDAYHNDVRVLGDDESLNQSLEKAGRVEDFFELAELMCRDALHREESCGGHFRDEHQTADNEALRDDDNFSYVAAWEFGGIGAPARLQKEDLRFEHVKLAQRSYK